MAMAGSFSTESWRECSFFGKFPGSIVDGYAVVAKDGKALSTCVGVQLLVHYRSPCGVGKCGLHNNGHLCQRYRSVVPIEDEAVGDRVIIRKKYALDSGCGLLAPTYARVIRFYINTL